MPVSVYFVFMHIPCIMYDGKGTAMGQTASTQKPSDKPQDIAVNFFALALILAHVISFATGSRFWGLCTYPAAWLIMIVFMMVRHWRRKGTAMGQTASTQKPSDKPQDIAVNFFALALILAHVISFATGSRFWGLCTYPATWLIMIIFMVIRHWRRNSEG